MTVRASFVGVVAAVLVSAVAVLGAQPGRPKAQVTAATDEPIARAGTVVRVSLNVTLPADVHVQSDKPRDPSLIPTVLTIDAPAGVVVTEIVYPTPTELTQEGQKQPLAVFGSSFTITARLTLAKDLAAGDVAVPARLRYQACDARACYPPARADAGIRLKIADR
jgi:DsbC/DsbD-like thiol-disulfide interchange protein